MLTPATMEGIKPIETAYKGYRFRSRLEARWAVFFDAMGCPWEYEPEGFVLPGGLCYLPDFHIDPEPADIPGGIWVEVKGQMTPDDAKKISLFSKEYRTIVLRDVPENYQEFFKKYTNIPPKDWSRVALWQRHLINKALHEARGARFEHGEKPGKPHRPLPSAEPQELPPAPPPPSYRKNRKRVMASETVCGICGKPVDKTLNPPDPLAPCIDHIIPISRGGHPSDRSNLQLAHWCCNQRKRAFLSVPIE